MRSDPAPHRAAARSMPSPTSAPASHHLHLCWHCRAPPHGLLLRLRAPSILPSGRCPALVGLTLVQRAEEKGAPEFSLRSPSVPNTVGFVCLDGSAPSAERVWEWISELVHPLGGWRLVPEFEVM